MKMIARGMIVLLTILYTGPAMSEEAAGPRIEMSEIRHDFGKISQGTQVVHVFTVRSVGSETLIIEKIQPS